MDVLKKTAKKKNFSAVYKFFYTKIVSEQTIFLYPIRFRFLSNVQRSRQQSVYQ